MVKIRERSVAMVKWECSGCGAVYAVQKDQLSQHTPEKSCERCKKAKAESSSTPKPSTAPEKKG